SAVGGAGAIRELASGWSTARTRESGGAEKSGGELNRGLGQLVRGTANERAGWIPNGLLNGLNLHSAATSRSPAPSLPAFGSSRSLRFLPTTQARGREPVSYPQKPRFPLRRKGMPLWPSTARARISRNP